MLVKNKSVALFQTLIPCVTAHLNDSNSLFRLSKLGYYLYEGPSLVQLCVCVIVLLKGIVLSLTLALCHTGGWKSINTGMMK
jgi:hypothetical protein